MWHAYKSCSPCAVARPPPLYGRNQAPVTGEPVSQEEEPGHARLIPQLSPRAAGCFSPRNPRCLGSAGHALSAPVACIATRSPTVKRPRAWEVFRYKRGRCCWARTVHPVVRSFIRSPTHSFLSPVRSSCEMNPFILLLIPAYNALPLSTNVTRSASTSGYCEAAKDIVTGLMDYHQGDGTFIAAYWWQSGEAYTSLLNYQHICDDSQFEDDVYTGILSQVGSDYDFQPSSQNGQIGNDDIGSWALTAMLAAETGFKSGGHDWIDIVKNSYELLMDRWDNDTCHGGIRWQFDKARSGWDYKAHIANGNLFQLAGRLARYTGESSYVADATRIYNWISEVGLINELEYGTEVYDGVDTSRCGDVTKVLWTYNYGVLIGGSAYLYDATGEQTWKDRLSSILLGSQILYNDTILYERACELYDSCDLDQKVFKGVYLRYLGFATRLVPDVTDDVLALIAPSAKAAAKSCTGGSDGQTCGIDWSLGYWDGTWGPQQQLTALEVMLNQIAYKTTISKA